MKQKLFFILLLVGILLMAAALIVPLIALLGVDIVGGAGWPTFALYFCKTAWLALIGLVFVGVSVAMHIFSRK